MKKSFDSHRIINENWQIDGIKKPFPTFCVKSLNPTNKCLIYIPGLNGNGSMIKYFNYKVFDDCYLFSFDPRAQGNNENKASRNYKKYINDIEIIINEFKKQYPFINQIYLSGESWGSTLAILTYNKLKNQINGTIGWNMPYDVVDVSTEKGWSKFKKSMKVLWTFLTSINTYDEATLVESLTNNRVLLKVVQMVKRNKLNNKIPLAAWRSFKKAWKVLINNNLNIKYIQSKEDVLLSKKRLNEISKINNVIIFEKGYHILSFDDNVSDSLFNEIYKFIM